MYSLMSNRIMASSESNMNSAKAFASSVLPTPLNGRCFVARDRDVSYLQMYNKSCD